MSHCPFTIRRCLFLCLPALLIGAALRLSMAMTFQEGFYGRDSSSYFSTAKRLWNEHKWSVGEKRRWAYPVVLAVVSPLPGTPSRTMPLVQNLAGWAALLGVGWITGHVTRRRSLWVPLVTTMTAIWPLMLWYEQEIQAEALFVSAYILAVALLFPVTRLRDGKRLMWFLLAAALVVALKPHGRGLWAGCVGAALLLAGPPWRWPRRDLAAAAVGLLLIATSGSSRQGNSLFLSSVLPLVPTEGRKWPEERAALAPFIKEARAQLEIYPWKQGHYKGGVMTDQVGASLSPEWAAIVHDRERYVKVCGDFVHEAIAAHPIELAYLSITKCGLGFAHKEAPSRLAPAQFWKEQQKINAPRWKDDAKEMELYFEFGEERFREVAAEGAQRTFWAQPLLERFSESFNFAEDSQQTDPTRYTVRPTWLGVLALAGLLVSIWRFRQLTVLWLPLGLYLASVFAVGDRLDRYVQPVEWVGLILAALFLDTLLNLIPLTRLAAPNETNQESSPVAPVPPAPSVLPAPADFA